MDGDLIAQMAKMVSELDGEDLLTLQGMAELVNERIGQVQFELMLEWRSQGWTPNAPGLRCEACGGRTWGKDEGRVEMVKCIDVGCGHLKMVVVK